MSETAQCKTIGGYFNFTSPTYMANWRQTWKKSPLAQVRSGRARPASARQLPVVEILEPRVLYSADSVASLLPLLLPDELDIPPSVSPALLFDADDALTINDVRHAPSASELSIKHVVFLDSAVPDVDVLSVAINNDTTDVVVIEANADALLLVTETLAAYGDLSSVQIVSHGSSGQLYLGSESVDEQDLLNDKAAIARWSDALSADGDILLLGCDVASGEKGEHFVDQLAHITGVDVAASTDKTGHESADADWDLEYATGAIQTHWQSDESLKGEWSHTLGVVTVDTFDDKFSNVIQDTWDVGSLMSYQLANNFEVSLREAVYVAQNFDDIDTIRLPSGDYTLSLLPSGPSDGKTGDLAVSEDTIILGLGTEAAPTSISQAAADTRIITAVDGTLELSNVTLSDANYTQGSGGAVYSDSDVVLTDTVIENNVSSFDGGAVATIGSLTVVRTEVINNSSAGFGGALYSEGALTIEASQFTGNQSENDGGAVYAQGQTLTIRDSSFTGNSTDTPDAAGFTGDGGAVAGTSDIHIVRSSFDGNTTLNVDLNSKGGAVHHDTSGVLTVSDVTFSGNQSVSAGALYTDQSATVSNVTFVDNQAILNGAAVLSDGGVLDLDSSILSNNDFRSPAAAGSSHVVIGTQHVLAGNVESQGFNLFDYDAGTELTPESTDIVNTDAQAVAAQLSALAATADGIVKVHNLVEGSQAINAGMVSAANAQDAQSQRRDQVSDIGSSEFNSTDSVVVWADTNGDIFRSDLDFTNVQPIVTAAPGIEALRVHESQAAIYWLANGNTEVSTASLDGIGGQSTLLPNLIAATGLALDSAAAHLYISFAGATPRIERYDLNNLATPPVVVIDNNGSFSSALDPSDIIANPSSIAFNANSSQLAWVEQGGGDVSASIRLFDATSNSIVVISDSVVANSVTINSEGTEVYWTETASDLISHYDIDSDTYSQYSTQAPDDGPGGIAYANSEDTLVWVSNVASSITSIDEQSHVTGSRYVHSESISDVATLQTLPVTDLPVVQTNNALNLNEGSEKLIEELQLSATDADSALNEIVYTVTTAPVSGEVLLNGIPTVQFTQQDINDDVVVYRHDGSESTEDQIEFQISDGLNSGDRFKYDVSINAVNDAPSLTIATDAQGSSLLMYLEEGGVNVLSPSLLMGSDPETPADDLVYNLLSAVTAGVFTVDGVESVSFTGAQLSAGNVVFEHDGSEVAPSSLSFQMFDGASENNESGSVTIDFDFILVNDSPVLTTTPISVYENETVTISNQNLVIDDPDLGTEQVFYNLAVMPDHGSIHVGNTQLLSTTDTFTQIDLNNSFVTYTPSVNDSINENTTYSLLFVATDPQGGVSGPVALDVVLTGVNNPPEMRAEPMQMEEGGELILTIANLIVSDSDTPSSDWVLGYRATDASNGTVSVLYTTQEIDEDGYLTFSYRDLLVGNVVYRHDGSESENIELAFRLSDGISKTEDQLLRISVTPVNDEPSIALVPDGFLVDEGGQYVFQSDDFSISDNDATDEDLRIFHTSSENAKGQILVNGEANTFFTLSDLANGLVVYEHSGAEPDIAGFTDDYMFSVTDGVASSSESTLTFDIQSTNDLPVITFVPSEIPIEENTEGVVIGRIDYSDADTGDVVALSIADDRFELIANGEGSYIVRLKSGESLDFEEDTNTAGVINLEIVAVDTNPDVERNPVYQGVQQEEALQIVDINDAPLIDLAAVANEVQGDGYTFESAWVVDQDHEVDGLTYSATLVDGSELPAWLDFNAESRQFAVLDPISEEVKPLDITINIDDGAGGTNTVTIKLYFEPSIEAEVIEPEAEPEPEELEPELGEAAPVLNVGPDDIDIDLGALLNPAAPAVTSVTLTPGSGADTALELQDTILADAAQRAQDLRDELLDQKVDLHDLIKPLDSFGALELAQLDSDNRAGSDGNGSSKLDTSVDLQNLSELFADSQAAFNAQNALLSVAMDNKEYPDEERSAAMRALFGTSTGISTGLSVGYLIWLIRGGTLMGSVLSSLPAWRFVDPLPVLGSVVEDNDNDDESLESIVNQSGEMTEVVPPSSPSMAARFARAVGLKH